MNLFEHLYKKNNLRFINFAYSYVKQIEIAEDIVSDSFIILLDHLDKLAQDSNLEAYCLAIIKNKCLDHLRHQEIHYRTIKKMQDITLWDIRMSISSLEACNPSEMFSKEIKTIVNNTLKELGQRTSEVFILCRIKNKTYKEIADELGISKKGVEFHISKALSLLRKRLKEHIL